MSTHNIGFYEDLTKTIFEISSNTYLISSADKRTSSSRLYVTMPSLVYASTGFFHYFKTLAHL